MMTFARSLLRHSHKQTQVVFTAIPDVYIYNMTYHADHDEELFTNNVKS